MDAPADAPPAPRVAAVAELSPAACAAALAERFPALFGAGRALPIKLRIQADIQQRAPGLFSKKSLSVFLHRHTTSTAYIKALLNSPHRFDLDGQPAGEIAQEHRAAATTELERRLALVQARRVAEREAQRLAYRQAAAAAREAQPARPEGPPMVSPGPGTDQRPARPARPPRTERTDRPDRPPRPPRAEGTPSAPAPLSALPPAPLPAPLPSPTPAPTPEQAAENEARRSRAALLRSFETSTVTRANFCALKGMRDDALEVLLVRAREERKLNPPPPERERERAAPERARLDDRGPRRGPPGDRPPPRPQRRPPR